MVKKNYTAWEIDNKGFSPNLSDDEKLRFFARYAILAPSGHNTQPWKLKIDGGLLEVSVNRDHFLSIDGSGLLSSEPLVSIGAFLETLALAARGFGYSLDVKFVNKGDLVAKVTLAEKTKAEPELLEAISARVSNRYAFVPVSVKPAELKKIISQDYNGVSICAVASDLDIEFVASQTETAMAAIMSNPEYRLELSHWVRNNQTKRFDGMPGFTHGFGNIQSLVSKAAIKHAPSQGPGPRKSAELIRHSGALVIVCCKQDSNEAFLNAGRQYASICVEAEKIGLASSALGAAALDPVTREALKKHFKFSERPVFILRLGKATRPAGHAPRWPLEKVLA